MPKELEIEKRIHSVKADEFPILPTRGMNGNSLAWSAEVAGRASFPPLSSQTTCLPPIFSFAQISQATPRDWGTHEGFQARMDTERYFALTDYQGSTVRSPKARHKGSFENLTPFTQTKVSRWGSLIQRSRTARTYYHLIAHR